LIARSVVLVWLWSVPYITLHGMRAVVWARCLCGRVTVLLPPPPPLPPPLHLPLPLPLPLPLRARVRVRACAAGYAFGVFLAVVSSLHEPHSLALPPYRRVFRRTHPLIPGALRTDSFPPSLTCPPPLYPRVFRSACGRPPANWSAATRHYSPPPSRGIGSWLEMAPNLY
jgi:hypothetical protein